MAVSSIPADSSFGDPGAAVRRVAVSFEFFPPTDAAMESLLWKSLHRLQSLDPRFVSVTYGADGSTRDRTHNIVRCLQTETPLNVAPHLTCIGVSRDEVLEMAKQYWAQGIRHLVALRGDVPPGLRGVWSANGSLNSVELVQALVSVGVFDISVAAYPEVHPEAASARADLTYLKRKIEAGATRAITQFFFDNDVYLRFRDACAASGINVPIVPGILPVTQFPQIQKFANRCGTRIPERVAKRFEGLDNDVITRHLVSAALAIEQVEDLRRHGVNEFHFYTLNRAELTYAICRALGLQPKVPVRRATSPGRKSHIPPAQPARD